MAESSIKLTNVISGLECKVCMEIFEKPKQLACGHTYCKDCIDRMVQFKPDSSGDITCPNRCRGATHIDTSSTTNDLPSNYVVINLLDAIKEQSKGVINNCSHDVNCANEGSTYCATCSMILCLPCRQAHNLNRHNSEDKTQYSLMYDRNDEKTKIICKKHETKADFFCCGGLICAYCKERSHRAHAVETVTQQAVRIREVLNNKDYGDVIDTIKENRLITERSIDSVRASLQKLLTHRKQQSLIEHLKKLNAEEERLLATFDHRTKEQIKNYPKLSAIKADILEKKDFEILLKKDMIAIDIADLVKPIPIISIKLATASATTPLGDIHVECRGSTSVKVSPALSSVVSGISALEIQECEKNSIELIKKLTKLMSQAYPTYVDYVAKLDTAFEKIHEEEKKIVKREGKSYVTGLFQAKEEQLIIHLVIRFPSLLQWKDIRGRNFLHFAAIYNSTNVLSYLVKYININQKDSGGSAPLHCAVLNNSVDCVKLLLEFNADTNITNSNGRTPLHCAVWNNSVVDCVKLLLEFNADTNITDNVGWDTFALCRLEQQC